VYENHPVFLARRMRAEFAALEGKPHLALRKLKHTPAGWLSGGVLRQGEQCTSAPVWPDRPAKAASGRSENSRFWDLDVRKPSVGVSFDYFRDNQERQNWGISAEGGANLTQPLRLGVHAGVGQLRQEVTSNDIAEAEGRTLQVDEKNAGVNANYKFSSGANLAGDLTLRNFSGDASRDEAAYSVETQFRPILFVDVMQRLEHDMVPSRWRFMTTSANDAPIGYAVVRLQDWWDAPLSESYYDFSDDNNREHLRAGTSWTIWERTGMNVGLQLCLCKR
jgi:hypothetical protein